MACTVSFSDDDVWMIRNSIYRWFIDIVAERVSDDPDVVSELDVSLAMHGLSIDVLEVEAPALSARICVVLSVVAAEIASGEHLLTDPEGLPWPDMQDKANTAFSKLCAMFQRHGGNS